MYIPKGAVCKSIVIRIARLIMSGDIEKARKLAHSKPYSWYSNGRWIPRSWSVSEARAIIGACRVSYKIYGFKVNPWTLV